MKLLFNALLIFAETSYVLPKNGFVSTSAEVIKNSPNWR